MHTLKKVINVNNIYEPFKYKEDGKCSWNLICSIFCRLYVLGATLSRSNIKRTTQKFTSYNVSRIEFFFLGLFFDLKRHTGQKNFFPLWHAFFKRTHHGPNLGQKRLYLKAKENPRLEEYQPGAGEPRYAAALALDERCWRIQSLASMAASTRLSRSLTW